MENNLKKASTPIRSALISVFNKEGLEPLAKSLHKLGATLYSTGGTAKFLETQCQVPCVSVESVTQFPEMMDGRIKTLHPRIFGGILARRENAGDISQTEKHAIPLIDLVVCNLYPFEEHLNTSIENQIEFVDIGGPSMIRAAAKNHEHVAVLSDPNQYPDFIKRLEEDPKSLSKTYRQQLAAEAFGRTAHYDATIAQQWTTGNAGLPTQISLSPQSELRYGENPHQEACWVGHAKWKQLQGKALSYNNLLDAEATLQIPMEFEEPCIAIVKHNNPCGVAAGNGSLAEIFERALAGDSKSAFGGIVAMNRPLDATTAQKISDIFFEVILAPEVSVEAKQILERKKNLRLIEWPTPTKSDFNVRHALGGWLVQSADKKGIDENQLKTVSSKTPSDSQLEDLKFAWLVCKHVKSNAIVIAKNKTTIGIGAGQMSRVDAVELALKKCGSNKLDNAVLASDAFFPFRDSIDFIAGNGISAVIQPGGSVRDEEVLEAANEHGLSMVFTGTRHFKH